MIEGIETQFERIGNIKIGKKGAPREKNGKTYRMPQKDDHFTITTMELDENEDWVVDAPAMKFLAEHGFGDKPKAIPVILLFDSIGENFFYEMAEYTQAGRLCHGNRVTATRIDHATGEEMQVTCPCPRLESKHCKPRGILSVELPLSNRVGGVYQFRTTGWASIKALVNSMKSIRSPAHTDGLLAGVPLVLTVGPRKVTPKGTGQSQTIYVVSIEYRGNPEISATATEQLQAIGQRLAEARLTRRNSGIALESHAESLAEDLPEDVQDMNEEFKGHVEQQEIQVAQGKEPESDGDDEPDFFAEPKPTSKPQVNPNDDPDIPF